jgi:hypothetical protein
LAEARGRCGGDGDAPASGTERRGVRFLSATSAWPQGGLAPGETGARMKTDVKSFLIGGLLVAVLVLGYLLWDRQRNTVEIRLPSIAIEKR